MHSSGWRAYASLVENTNATTAMLTPSTPISNTRLTPSTPASMKPSTALPMIHPSLRLQSLLTPTPPLTETSSKHNSLTSSVHNKPPSGRYGTRSPAQFARRCSTDWRHEFSSALPFDSGPTVRVLPPWLIPAALPVRSWARLMLYAVKLKDCYIYIYIYRSRSLER